MSKLEAENNHQQLIHVYRTATQIIVIIVGSTAMLLSFHHQTVLRIWTANEIMVQQASIYVKYYSLGYMLLAFSAFPYYLQYAKGDMKLHIYGNFLFITLLIPSLLVLVKLIGGAAAAYVWLGVNAIYFLIWVPVVHHKFDKQLNAQWYVKDIAALLVPVITINALAYYVIETPSGLISGIIYLAAIWLLSIIASLGRSAYLRNFVIDKINNIIRFGRL